MSIIQAIVLAIIQGITEFLPISSSGHLIAVPWLLGWKEHSLTFDVMLHAGTMVAILAYFWHDWARLLSKTVLDIRGGRFLKGPDSRLVSLILVASIPAAVLGLKLDDMIESTFRSYYVMIGVLMIFMGFLLLFADIINSRRRQQTEVRPLDAIIIGLAQACALFPGVSRSGATITAGMFAGLTREAAARFSFLLATPIILGASFYKLLKLGMQIMHDKPLEEPIGILVIGFLISSVVGYASISWLLSYLRTRSMTPFVLYRILFGILLIFAAKMQWMGF